MNMVLLDYSVRLVRAMPIRLIIIYWEILALVSAVRHYIVSRIMFACASRLAAADADPAVLSVRLIYGPGDEVDATLQYRLNILKDAAITYGEFLTYYYGISDGRAAEDTAVISIICLCGTNLRAFAFDGQTGRELYSGLPMLFDSIHYCAYAEDYGKCMSLE